jgi:hypothetical protein
MLVCSERLYVNPPLVLRNRADGVPQMATGGTSGQVAVWHLQEKKLLTIMKVLSLCVLCCVF